MSKKVTAKIENVYGKGSKDFVEFQTMVSEYQTFKTTDIDTMRLKHRKFGKYLEKFYTDCKKVKLTRDQISELVTQYFPGLKINDRSVYRKYCEHYEEIIAHAKETHSLSTYPQRLLNLWRSAVKQKEVDKKSAELKAQGIAVDEKTGEPEKVVTRKKDEVIVNPLKIKSGIIAENPSGIPEPFEVIQHFIARGNQIIQCFNSDKFTAEQINEIERFITNMLNHINSTDVIDKVFEISERKSA